MCSHDLVESIGSSSERVDLLIGVSHIHFGCLLTRQYVNNGCQKIYIFNRPWVSNKKYQERGPEPHQQVSHHMHQTSPQASSVGITSDSLHGIFTNYRRYRKLLTIMGHSDFLCIFIIQGFHQIPILFGFAQDHIIGKACIIILLDNYMITT